MTSGITYVRPRAAALAGALALALVALHVAAADDLTTARKALGDGLWEVALKRAEAAESDVNKREEARLTVLEALARSGRSKEIAGRLEKWGNPKGDVYRYWSAWALAREGRREEALAGLREAFVTKELAVRAARLRARLMAQTGERADFEKEFRTASALLANDPEGKAENAVEWARALAEKGDAAAGLAVLKAEKAMEAPGASGERATLAAAELAASAGDAAGARRLREKLMSGATDETAAVAAAAAVAGELASAGDTAGAMAAASNAVRRAKSRVNRRTAALAMGFAELGAKATRRAGADRITATVREDPDAPGMAGAMLRMADTLLAAGAADAALKAYGALLQTYPAYAMDVHVLEGRGWALAAAGRSAEAVGAFARAAQVATNEIDRARCVFKQGDALAASGRFAEAAQTYAEVKAGPLLEKAVYQRADSLVRADRLEEATELFGALIEGGGAMSAQAGLRLADAEAAAGRIEQAVSDYDRTLALKLSPPMSKQMRADVVYGRGRAYYRVYRFAEAAQDFAKVAELVPARSQEMRFLGALCSYGAGRDEEARKIAKNLLGEMPDVPLREDVRLWLAKCDAAARDWAAARRGFEMCATNRHATVARRLEALVRAARCAAAQGAHEDTVDLVTRAVEGFPADAAGRTSSETAWAAEGMVLQSEALMDLARFDEAVLVLERAARLPAGDTLRRRAAVLRADCLFARGADDPARYREALEAYRGVLGEENPPPSLRIEAAFKIGRTLEKLGRFDEAADQYYANVVTAYCDGLREGTWFDAGAKAFFSRAAFILADWYETQGRFRQAARVLGYLPASGAPAAEEAKARIERLKRKGGGG